MQLENARLSECEFALRRMYALTRIIRPGIKLEGTGGTVELYCQTEFEQQEWLREFRRVCICGEICKHYSFDCITAQAIGMKVRPGQIV